MKLNLYLQLLQMFDNNHYKTINQIKYFIKHNKLKKQSQAMLRYFVDLDHLMKES